MMMMFDIIHPLLLPRCNIVIYLLLTYGCQSGFSGHAIRN